MNLILFTVAETEAPLPAADPRARHIVQHLRRGRGEAFDVGLIDGPRGKAWIVESDADSLLLEFRWEDASDPPIPLILGAGFPRPQSARRILRDTTALGVGALHFFDADKGVPTYRESRLWSTGEYRRHLVEGAEQAFSTRLPALELHSGLDAFLGSLPPDSDRLALDLYEAGAALASADLTRPGLVLAVGPERGWSARERQLLRAADFRLVHLGRRVLRSDTACLCAVGLALHRMALL